MTKEPFIAYSELTNEIYIVVGKEKSRVTEQAIKAVMAIKALGQEPCEDVISRAEALKVIKQMDIPEDMSVRIGVEIGTLPPATPKRKVGEWIKKNNDYFDWYECSECGYGSDGEMKYNRLCDVRTKFCPDCGSQNLKGE